MELVEKLEVHFFKHKGEHNYISYVYNLFTLHSVLCKIIDKWRLDIRILKIF